jgi:hypothetical protein
MHQAGGWLAGPSLAPSHRSQKRVAHLSAAARLLAKLPATQQQHRSSRQHSVFFIKSGAVLQQQLTWQMEMAIDRTFGRKCHYGCA